MDMGYLWGALGAICPVPHIEGSQQRSRSEHIRPTYLGPLPPSLPSTPDLTVLHTKCPRFSVHDAKDSLPVWFAQHNVTEKCQRQCGKGRLTALERKVPGREIPRGWAGGTKPATGEGEGSLELEEPGESGVGAGVGKGTDGVRNSRQPARSVLQRNRLNPAPSQTHPSQGSWRWHQERQGISVLTLAKDKGASQTALRLWTPSSGYFPSIHIDRLHIPRTLPLPSSPQNPAFRHFHIKAFKSKGSLSTVFAA